MSKRGGWGGTQGSACAHTESARTDASGRYHVPPWTVKLGLDGNGNQQSWLPFTFPYSMDVSALKPGYIINEERPLGSPRAIDLTATKFPGTDAEWFAEWVKRTQFDERCDGNGARVALEEKVDIYQKFGHATWHKEYVEFSKQRLKDEDFSKGWITHPSPKPTVQKNQ